MSNLTKQGERVMDGKVVADNIKLIVTIDGQEHALEMKNEDLGTKRQVFLDRVESIAMLLALELQDRGILPYKDFAVINDAKSGNSVPSAGDFRTIGERPKEDV